MRIDAIELRNIGVFKQYEVTFGTGLIGITGPNGAGKTTLVNAIYAALTNDFTRLAPTKGDAITRGCEDTSYICVKGSHYNMEFTLTRWLRPNKQELIIGDKKYTAAADINQAIEEILNVSKATIDNYVFVDQWQMFNFINQNISERAKLFQHLCGITDATQIFKTCSDFLAKNKNVEVLDNSVELLHEIQQLKSKKQDLEYKAAAVKAQMPSALRINHHKMICENYVKQEADKLKLVELQENLSLSQAKLEKATKKYEALNNAIKEKQVVVDAKKAKSDKAKELLTAYEAYNNKQKNIKKEKQKLEQLKLQLIERQAGVTIAMEPEGYLAEQERYDAISRMGEIQQQIKACKKVVEIQDPKCPVCSQSVTPEFQEQQYKLYKKLQKEFKRLDLIVEASKQYEKAVLAVEQGNEDLEEAINMLEVKIATLKSELPQQVSEEKLAKANQFLASLTASELKLEEAKNALTVFSNSCSVHSTAVSMHNKGIEELQKSLDDFIDEEVYEHAKNQLELHESNKLELSRILGAYEANDQQIEFYSLSYDRLQERLAEVAEIQNKLAILERVKNIFHWNELPKRVAQSNINLLVDDINEILAMFANPFYVEADEDLSFQVFLPGKLPVSAKQLSGGQKVILAIAFRAALDKVFGHNIGMLFLDEPTSGLDADNVKYFHDTLKQLATTVGSDRQLIMITHVHEFQDAFDQLITVGS